MYFGTSLLLFAIGAILHWAVTDRLEGIDLSMVGLILMIVGGVAFLFSLFYEISRRERTHDRVTERPVAERPVERVVERRDVR